MGFWDGNIYLFSYKTRKIYNGLLYKVEEHCRENGYEFINPEPVYVPWDDIRTKDYISTLRIPAKYDTRDYQLDTVVDCINAQRRLFVSPTGSGKSLIIYMLARFNENEGSTLIIVPNVGLIRQMTSDFIDYGYSEDNIHQIFSGKEKLKNAPIVISTWQSIYKLPAEWFKDFVCVIGDEAHKAKAVNLKGILEKMTNTKYRYGMTGSLDGTETNKLVLEGLFGQAKQIVTTAELIDRKVLANLNVKMLILKHPESVCKDVTSVKDYHYEIAKIVSSNERNNYICKLALGLAEENKNVMILYQYVDDHGILLYDKIIQSTDDTPKYIIHGKIKAEIREQTRQAIIASDRSITVASMGCFAEGINIPNLDYLILASPTKSRVKVMQMIGRVLRRTETKHECIVFDIVDDLMYKNRINYTMKHYRERLKYYTEENFKYTQYKINLTDLSTK